MKKDSHYRPGRPAVFPSSTVADFVSQRIRVCEKTQKEIALALGYKNANVIAMIKSGSTKVPLRVVPHLARELAIDEAFFMRMVLREYMPETLVALESVYRTPVTQNETEILSVLRDRTSSTDPELRTEAQEEKLAEFCRSLLDAGDPGERDWR
ncbi:MAG TPA: XRE family transcriptional regulator [Gammaproteobacteria bacterium]|nr:XRE family transcriptional regulator [Gammaproteobacteria bacterium]